MIVSHSRRFVFVHVHKTAGEAVTAALVPHLGREDIVIESDYKAWARSLVNPRYRDFRQFDKHDPAVVLRAKLPHGMWDGYFTFAVVRNPVERAISLYRYIGMVAGRRMSPRWRNLWYRMPPGRRMDPLRWHGAIAYRESANFAEFIRHPEALRDPGMRPQVDSVCVAGEQIVDVVAHFESLAEDLASIGDRLGIPGLRVPRVNVTRGADPRITGINDADIRYLEELYSDDLRSFGYRK